MLRDPAEKSGKCVWCERRYYTLSGPTLASSYPKISSLFRVQAESLAAFSGTHPTSWSKGKHTAAFFTESSLQREDERLHSWGESYSLIGRVGLSSSQVESKIPALILAMRIVGVEWLSKSIVDRRFAGKGNRKRVRFVSMVQYGSQEMAPSPDTIAEISAIFLKSRKDCLSLLGTGNAHKGDEGRSASTMMRSREWVHRSRTAR